MSTIKSRSYSGWAHFEAWRNARRSAVQRSLDDAATYSKAFTSAFLDDISGQAKLATQAALKRIQAETKAKLDQAAAIKLDKTA